MASKHTKVSRRWLFTWFMLGGLIMLFAPRGLTGKFQLGFMRVFRWPLSIGGDFALTRSTDQSLQDTVPRKEYDKLQNHINNLQATLDKERKRSVKFSMYNDDNVWEGKDTVLAKVITSNVKGTRNELTIDYSRNAKLEKDQFVLGLNSIIGRISEASAGTAQVMLFTDPKSAIPVKIGNLDVPMVIKGKGDNSAGISLVSTEHKIKLGDTVFTSIKVGDTVFASDARNRFLDAPVMIGTVDRCVKSLKNPLVWDITVKPACDIESLEDVAVIIMNSQQ